MLRLDSRLYKQHIGRATAGAAEIGQINQRRDHAIESLDDRQLRELYYRLVDEDGPDELRDAVETEIIARWLVEIGRRLFFR